MKKINCDVVVVGAGPGGSMAAKTCAKYGLDTVLVERKEYPEHSRSDMNTLIQHRIFEYVKIDESIIHSKVWGIKQYFPDGTEISTREPEGYDIAYIMNRKVFDKRVLELALKEGAKFMNKTRVTGLLKEEEKVKGVKAKIDEKEDVEIRSDIVIGADGVESNVGSWAGIYKKSLKIMMFSLCLIVCLMAW
jgi:Dehydrogenases (flavoproteins)